MVQVSTKRIRIFLLLITGYTCIVTVIYVCKTAGNRLTVPVQRGNVFLFPNKEDSFNLTSKTLHIYRYRLPLINYSTIIKPSTQQGIFTTKRPLKHRTFLKTRTRCTQRFPLLILVPSSPLNFENRRVIRQTWGTDHAMNKTWKTMFLLGQPQHLTEKRYLSSETEIYGDIVQGFQTDSYYNLTLKTEMGLEWAAKYCDFDFLLKADDDVFVNSYKLVDYLRKPQTPKSKLYLGNVAQRSSTVRDGKWALSYQEYKRDILPKFCLGPAYVLSMDLVHRFVEIFDPRKPLKLEDVYIGMLAAKVGVTPRKHQGFQTYSKNRQCSHSDKLIVIHEASPSCIIKLFNKALEERFRQIAKGKQV